MIVPLAVLAPTTLKDTTVYIVLSTVGSFSLFPLLFQEGETNIKVLLLLLQVVVTMKCLGLVRRRDTRQAAVSWLATLYLSGLVPVFFFQSVLHSVGLYSRFEFLPLVLYSTYCALGITGCFIMSYKHLSAV